MTRSITAVVVRGCRLQIPLCQENNLYCHVAAVTLQRGDAAPEVKHIKNGTPSSQEPCFPGVGVPRTQRKGKAGAWSDRRNGDNHDDNHGRLQLEKTSLLSATQTEALCFQASRMRGLWCKRYLRFSRICIFWVTEPVRLEILLSSPTAQAGSDRTSCPG